MAILYSFDIKAKILSLSVSSFYPFYYGLHSSSQFPLVLPMFLPFLSVTLFPLFLSFALYHSLSPFFLPWCVQCLGSLTLAPRKSYGRNYHTAGIIIRVYASVSLCRYDYPAFSSLFLSFFLIFWFYFFLFISCFLLSLPYFRFSLSPFRYFFFLPRSLFCARVQAFSRRFFPPFSFFFPRWSRVIEISGRLRLLRVSYR